MQEGPRAFIFPGTFLLAPPVPFSRPFTGSCENLQEVPPMPQPQIRKGWQKLSPPFPAPAYPEPHCPPLAVLRLKTPSHPPAPTQVHTHTAHQAAHGSPPRPAEDSHGSHSCLLGPCLQPTGRKQLCVSQGRVPTQSFCVCTLFGDKVVPEDMLLCNELGKKILNDYPKSIPGQIMHG